MKHRVWQAVTINGHKWAYRRHYGNGAWDQVEADMRNVRHYWYSDVMHYYSPINR